MFTGRWWCLASACGDVGRGRCVGRRVSRVAACDATAPLQFKTIAQTFTFPYFWQKVDVCAMVFGRCGLGHLVQDRSVATGRGAGTCGHGCMCDRLQAQGECAAGTEGAARARCGCRIASAHGRYMPGSLLVLVMRNLGKAIAVQHEQLAAAHAFDKALADELRYVARDGLGAQTHGVGDVLEA